MFDINFEIYVNDGGMLFIFIVFFLIFLIILLRYLLIKDELLFIFLKNWSILGWLSFVNIFDL